MKKQNPIITAFYIAGIILFFLSLFWGSQYTTRGNFIYTLLVLGYCSLFAWWGGLILLKGSGLIKEISQAVWVIFFFAIYTVVEFPYYHLWRILETTGVPSVFIDIWFISTGLIFLLGPVMRCLYTIVFPSPKEQMSQINTFETQKVTGFTPKQTIGIFFGLLLTFFSPFIAWAVFPARTVAVPFFPRGKLIRLTGDLSSMILRYILSKGIELKESEIPFPFDETTNKIRDKDEFQMLLADPDIRKLWRNDHFIDPWGNALRWTAVECQRFQIVEGKTKGENAYLVRVYSTGPNGIDEKGIGSNISDMASRR
jgi:hypothetical protein